VIDADGAVTSQSRHSLRLSGSPPHGKLLIPLSRRDVRVVEGARLESETRQQHRATPKRLNTHAISDLTTQNDYLVCVRKPLDVLRGFEPDVSQSYHNQLCQLASGFE
jgi:hypothetical protein